MSKKSDNFDYFDQLFDRLEHDQSFVNKTVAEFGKEIKETIDHSIKNKGYDNLSDLVVGSLKAQDALKPRAKAHSRRAVAGYLSRFQFVADALDQIQYETKFRGYYRDGHQEAIQTCLSVMKDDPENVIQTEEYIAKEIGEHRHQKGRRNDKFAEGYLDGLCLFKEELDNSKIYMMKKVKKLLESKKR